MSVPESIESNVKNKYVLTDSGGERKVKW